MAEPIHVRVVLDLEAESTPIRGTIMIAEHSSQPFFGWLELASQLERARSPALDVR